MSESQRQEVYAAPFPGEGGKVQISTTGGADPRWRSDGREIYYVAPDSRLMAAEVRANGPSLEVVRVEALFGGLVVSGSAVISYDVSLDGQRFLVTMPSGAAAPEPLTVVQNWTAGLKK